VICCENIVDVTFFFLIPPQDFGNHNSFFFFPSHFWQLGCHNSYFLSPQFPTISATWLPQLVKARQDKNFDNLITEIHFFFSPHHITQLSSLSYFFLTILATVLPKFNLSPHFANLLNNFE